MQRALRPYVTTGIALVGASAIAISPVAPPLPDVKAANPAVQLSAAIDPITPWLEVFNSSEVNVANLVNEWLAAPLPVLQQVIANQIGYLGQLPDVESIAGQILQNLQAAAEAPFAQDTSTLDAGHAFIYEILLTGLEPIIPPLSPDLVPIFELLTTSLSGVLLGSVGPVIGPVLALAATSQALIDNLTGETPDFEAALNTLINSPAEVADAFLNGGQTLDITPLVSLLGSDLLPEGTTVGLTFGGLLSPGGSIFNALDLSIPFGGVNLTLAGQGPGAIGSLIDLSKVIAKAIGWDGSGNPLDPPLVTSEMQSINTTNQRLVTLDVAPQTKDTGDDDGSENGLTRLADLPDQPPGNAQQVTDVLKENSPGRGLGQLVSSAARTDRPLLNVLKLNPLDRGANKDESANAGAGSGGTTVKHRPGLGKTPVRDLINKVVDGGKKKSDDDAPKPAADTDE